MELFYSQDIAGGLCHLDAEESGHCVKVLRHREGDEINVIDGEGTMYHCRLIDASPKGSEGQVLESFPDWGSHPYHLTMAVCPTKNNERFEWFAEKAAEVGVDRIVPVIGDHSERKVYKTDRLRKILLSATKQSLKAAIPEACEPISVKDFIKGSNETSADGAPVLRLIAYCFEGEGFRRTSVKEAIDGYLKALVPAEKNPKIEVLIGPEGDFSKEEATMAIEAGFLPVHLGASRLRTETAALTAVEAVYLALL